jgi:hypothetical protein
VCSIFHGKIINTRKSEEILENELRETVREKEKIFKFFFKQHFLCFWLKEKE